MNYSERERDWFISHPTYAVDMIELLRAENAELRKDAERYRWLRGSTEAQLKSIIPFDDLKQAVYEGFPATEKLDASIDAAMKEGK